MSRSFYDAGKLTKTTVTGPDGKSTITYKDLSGRSVLNRNKDVDENILSETYNEYDDRDQLRRVFPPESSPTTPNLIFEYRYNATGNVIYKKVPDRPAEKYYYDERELLTYVTGANMPSTTPFLATYYDAYGRARRSGFVGSVAANNRVTATTIPEANILTKISYGSENGPRFLRDKVTLQRTAVLDGKMPSGIYLSTVPTYDNLGSVRMEEGNHLLMTDNPKAHVTAFGYTSLNQIHKLDHQLTTPWDVQRTVATTHYDAAGRVERETHKYDKGAEIGRPTALAFTRYTPKDQVKQLGLGGSERFAKQVIDYKYLENGFLSAINDPANPGKDYFQAEYYYDDVPNNMKFPGLKNGNIAGMRTRTSTGQDYLQSFSYDGLDRLQVSSYVQKNGQARNRYSSSYAYDKRGNLIRLVRNGRGISGTYGAIDQLIYNYPATDETATNRIESIADIAKNRHFRKAGLPALTSGKYAYGYDGNGNVTRDPFRQYSVAYNHLNLPYLFRKKGGEVIRITYSADGTKLRERRWKGTKLLSDRFYLRDIEIDNLARKTAVVHHARGRMVPDSARPNNCDDIEVIGPTPPFDPGPFPGPLSRVRGGGGILGRTMTGTTVSPVQVEDTVVLNENGVVYEGRKVNSTVALPTGFDGLGLQATERVALLPGFASPKGTSFTAKTTDNCDDRVSWPYEYAIHDHLGNVRVRFTDEGVIEGEHHYYPFGLEMEGEWNAGLDDARYRYNGKELNQDLGLYDYGARWYDPAVARFTTTDPAAGAYTSISPYAYVANNPLIYIDPTGAYIEKGSQKEWNRQTGYVKKRRDKLQGKLDGLAQKAVDKGWSAEKLAKKTGNLADRVGSLNSTINTFTSLESSSQGYSLTNSSNEVTGLTAGKNGIIDIQFSSTANFIHEATHAGQFETGELAFAGDTGSSLLQDVGDEIESFQAQYGYDPGSVTGLTSSGGSVKEISDISASWIQGITTSTGDQLYAPGGSSNTGASPVNINSSKADFIRAYPHIQGSLRSLPNNWGPKKIKGIIYKR